MRSGFGAPHPSCSRCSGEGTEASALPSVRKVPQGRGFLPWLLVLSLYCPDPTLPTHSLASSFRWAWGLHIPSPALNVHL